MNKQAESTVGAPPPDHTMSPMQWERPTCLFQAKCRLLWDTAVGGPGQSTPPWLPAYKSLYLLPGLLSLKYNFETKQCVPEQAHFNFFRVKSDPEKGKLGLLMVKILDSPKWLQREAT